MFEKYSLFYSYKVIGDVLLVVFNEKAMPTSFIQKSDITVIYHNSEIIGYNIFNISKIVKIKTKGLIYYPSDVFIDIINSILRNQQLDILAHYSHSGYVIGQVVKLEKDDMQLRPHIDVGGKILLGQSVAHINEGDKVVAALIGARLHDGQEVEEKSVPAQIHICSNRELNISIDDEIYLVDEDGVVGDDFFKIGECKK
jgi:tRNA-binding protein